jgi:hypothetical protein
MAITQKKLHGKYINLKTIICDGLKANNCIGVECEDDKCSLLEIEKNGICENYQYFNCKPIIGSSNVQKNIDTFDEKNTILEQSCTCIDGMDINHDGEHEPCVECDCDGKIPTEFGQEILNFINKYR